MFRPKSITITSPYIHVLKVPRGSAAVGEILAFIGKFSFRHAKQDKYLSAVAQDSYYTIDVFCLSLRVVVKDSQKPEIIRHNRKRHSPNILTLSRTQYCIAASCITRTLRNFVNIPNIL